MTTGLIWHWRRIVQGNPVHPYAWEARYAGYADGDPAAHRLRQFDADGHHYAREIDRARLRSLVVLGHPASPIELWPPYSAPPFGPTPDEIVVRAVTDYRVKVGLGNGHQTREWETWCYFGFRYGAACFLVEIDEHGRLVKTDRVR